MAETPIMTAIRKFREANSAEQVTRKKLNELLDIVATLQNQLTRQAADTNKARDLMVQAVLVKGGQ